MKWLLLCIDFLNNNKEWIFSGIGVLVISTLFANKKKIGSFLVKLKRYFKYLRLKLFSDKENEPFDDSTFVSEYPSDGICIPVGKIFTKSWTIKNSGNTIWENRTLRCTEFVNDYFHPVDPTIKIPTTLPGQIITLKVKYYVTAEGCYSSKWKMFDDNDNLIYPNKTIGLGVNITAKNSTHYNSNQK